MKIVKCSTYLTLLQAGKAKASTKEYFIKHYFKPGVEIVQNTLALCADIWIAPKTTKSNVFELLAPVKNQSLFITLQVFSSHI